MAMPEFSCVVSQGGNTLFKFTVNKDDVISIDERPEMFNMEQFIITIGLFKSAIDYYRKFTYNDYTVELLDISRRPDVYEIHMTKEGGEFRTYTYDRKDNFMPTLLENNVEIIDFQTNNRLNQDVIIYMVRYKTWEFNLFRI